MYFKSTDTRIEGTKLTDSITTRVIIFFILLGANFQLGKVYKE